RASRAHLAVAPPEEPSCGDLKNQSCDDGTQPENNNGPEREAASKSRLAARPSSPSAKQRGGSRKAAQGVSITEPQPCRSPRRQKARRHGSPCEWCALP